MWPKIFSRIIVGLLIFELMSSGLFVLKKAYPLAVLCAPLVILTIVFKLTMDAAYLRSTRFLPLQLLTQKLGQPQTVAGPIDVPDPQPSVSTRTTGSSSDQTKVTTTTLLRRRRTVLDQDDYVAEPTRHTDYRQPPMTLVEGILNTGMKKYGHPALLGALPQLWLPVRETNVDRDRNNPNDPASPDLVGSPPITKSIRIIHDGNNKSIWSPISQSPMELCPSLSVGNNPLDERRPLLAGEDGTRQQEHEASVVVEEGSSIDTSSDEDAVGQARATYYHHPERRQSRRDLLGRSYGAVQI